jgi:hypothetical protein
VKPPGITVLLKLDTFRIPLASRYASKDRFEDVHSALDWHKSGSEFGVGSARVGCAGGLAIPRTSWTCPGSLRLCPRVS